MDLCPEEPNPLWKRHYDTVDIQTIVRMPQLKRRKYLK